MLWLERGTDAGRIQRVVVGAAAAALLLVLPVKRLVTIYTTHDALTLIPLYKLSQATSSGTMVAVYYRGRRRSPRSPSRWFRVGGCRSCRSCCSSGSSSSRCWPAASSSDQARAQQRTFLGDDPAGSTTPRTSASHTSTTASRRGTASGRRCSGTSTSTASTTSTPSRCPGRCRRAACRCSGDGTLVVRAGKERARSSRSRRPGSSSRRADGAGRAAGPDPGRARRSGSSTGRCGCVSRVSGLAGRTATSTRTREGRLVAYGCSRGTFRLTLLIKQPETVDISLDGTARQAPRLPLAEAENETWHGELPGRRARRRDVHARGRAVRARSGRRVFTFDARLRPVARIGRWPPSSARRFRTGCGC